MVETGCKNILCFHQSLKEHHRRSLVNRILNHEQQCVDNSDDIAWLAVLEFLNKTVWACIDYDGFILIKLRLVIVFYNYG